MSSKRAAKGNGLQSEERKELEAGKGLGYRGEVVEAQNQVHSLLILLNLRIPDAGVMVEPWSVTEDAGEGEDMKEETVRRVVLRLQYSPHIWGFLKKWRFLNSTARESDPAGVRWTRGPRFYQPH